MIKKLSIVVFLFVCIVNSYAYKSKEDSLLHELSICKVDSVKFNLNESLFLVHIRKGNYDVAKKYSEELMVLAYKMNQPKKIALAMATKANCFYRSGKLDSAIVLNNKSLEIAQSIHYYYVLIKSNINLGNVYIQKADYKKSVLYFQAAEHYSDLAHDTLGKISTTLNLGNVFYSINDYALAKRNFFKTINASVGSERTRSELASAYNNLATVFLNQDPKYPDSAMIYYQKFLEVSQTIGNQNSVALAYFNIAEALRIQKQLDKAEDYYTKAQNLFEEMGDSVSIIKVFLGLSDNYVAQKKYTDAERVLKLGLPYCTSNEMRSYVADFYKNLATAYYYTNRFKEAYDYYETGVLISDSLYNAENSQILYDLQTKYETNEKEKENLLLTSQNEISKRTIKQQQIITYFIAAILILSVLFGFLIFKGLKQQRKANTIISIQKQEVEHKNHIIEEKQKEILDSINYAKRIQYTLLAHHDFLKENIPQHFIYFNPKDIVSGDFYWATKRGDNFYLAVCDSTGHGVPGAFMSLLNIGFLNEAINEKQILQPNEIFNYVRQRLVSSISKEGQQDGFDGILLCVNQITKQITYAAANNSPIVVSDNKIIELNKDKMPVGIADKQESFNLYSIQVQTGDILYLYTDGYADQFGGDKGKKFKYKPLNELLLSLSEKPITTQADVLKEKFETWRGNLEQVDDVCVIGIKF